MDRVLAPRAILLAYVSGLAILPMVFAWIFIHAIRGGSIVEQRVLSLVVGYNALLVVSCLTTAVVVSLLILTLMRFARVLLVSLDAAGVFRVVATWTGYGTAAGVVTAAMLPVLNQLLPLSTSPDPETDLTATISPQLLIDIPAAGAVAGYGIGLTVSVVVLCRRAENLIIRWLLAPAIFVMVLVVLGANGIDPRGLFAVVSRSIAASTSGKVPECNATNDQFEERIADTPWVLQLMETCSPPFLVEGGMFVAGTGVAVMLLALVLMVFDFRRGIKELSEQSDLSEAR
ncbi:hypothetical protein [Leucobacter sp. M11]|uniref:hypothetical protein n=1 Tax=Leucobacter sp. M11 TaxID=2993565 RepID=UPI002D80DF57|nr:hypothetical protein [Leucobacter sp. M11]MEB4615812.1 hypothetical protein [Leucobacter sp. M11]